MDLEEFVSSALTQTARGIRKAQSDAADTGAWINPAGRMGGPEPGSTIEVDENILSRLDNVQFDVAVTASDEQRADAKAGLKIAVLGGLGASGGVSYQNTAVSRVQFRVPVVWPGSATRSWSASAQTNGFPHFSAFGLVAQCNFVHWTLRASSV